MVRMAMAFLIALVVAPAARGQESDDKLAKRVGKIDERFLKALVELAVQYDKAGDVEAPHWFAEVAMGLGSKDEKIRAIRWDTERKVYLGSTQGGKPIEKGGQITTKLSPIAKDYREVMEELEAIERKKKGTLGEAELKLLRDTGVKNELAAGAEEYIRATKRINELRNGMKLRSVLWDFENSSRLIRACAPASEAWSYFHEEETDLKERLEAGQRSRFWDEDSVSFMRKKSSRSFGEFKSFPDHMRSLCLWRDDLLNPNARRLWLGHWRYSGNPVHAYAIPLLPYRDDVPTPSQHYSGKTVASDWVTIEEILEANGRKIPFAHYPFRDEGDLPHAWGGWETGWISEEFHKKKLGLPIMLRFFGGEKLSEIEATLTTSRTGKTIEIRVYTNGSAVGPKLGEFPSLVLLPVELARGVSYTVSIKGKLDGVAFDRTWTFTTKAPK